MQLARRLLLVLLGAVLVVLGFASMRAAGLRSRQLPARQATPLPFEVDAQACAERLAGALRIQTISRESGPADPARFEELARYLERCYPLAFAALSPERLEGGSLRFRFPGREPGRRPVLLLAHLDTVPVEEGTEEDWAYPPFGGVVAEGRVFGRGAIDDKGSVCAILEACEHLLLSGRAPARTTWIAFGHDEELQGSAGAAAMARRFAEEGISFEYALDEGGFLTRDLLTIIDGEVALLGISEKGSLSVELVARGSGGHSSVPDTPTPAGRLSAVIARLEAEPFPARLDGAARSMLDFLAPELGFTQRVALANLELFGGLVTRTLVREPKSAALVRTTVAPTLLRAGTSVNILPQVASAHINLRLLPGDTVAGTYARIERLAREHDVEVSYARPGVEASPVSSVDSEAFRRIQRALRDVYPELPLAPCLVLGGTDGRHYTSVADDIYRLAPYLVTPEDVDRIHGTNEFVSVERHAAAVRFHARLLLEGGDV